MRPRNFLWSISLLSLLLWTADVRAEIRYYIAPSGNDAAAGTASEPFRTLTRAQQAIRELKEAGEVTEPIGVILREGTYPVASALRFTPQDGGAPQAPVTYQAAKGERVVLSGGRQITGWKRYKGNLWVTTLPEVKAGAWWFRQLYVNGEYRGRARTPNTGFLHVKALTDAEKTMLSPFRTQSYSFEFFPGDLDPKWKNQQDAEVTVYHYWTDTHLPVEKIEGNVISFSKPSRKYFMDGEKGDMARYMIENLMEVLDSPGEWVLNRTTGQLFYWPKEGEDLSTAEVIAPATTQLLSLEGDAANGSFVEALHFKNIGFSYTNFFLPDSLCNNAQASAEVAACVDLHGARGCSFTDCAFTNLGTYAVELFEGCTFNTFRHNRIEQIAAGGFRLRGVPAGGMPALRSGNNTFSDNTIAYYGVNYPSAVAILIMHSDENTVSHNLIHHGDYTGISVGWSWGYRRSIARGNRIEQNHIHHIGYNNLLSDMGGIYTLGLSAGTVVKGNLIHDVNANQYGGWGIYNDEGSTSILVENNVVYNTKFGTYDIHYAKDIVVRNNIFALGTLEQLSRDHAEPHATVYFEGNIVYWTQGKLLVKEWIDKPYVLYTGHEQAPLDTAVTFTSDWNLFYNPNLPLDRVDFNGRTWKQWQADGKDLHSIYADPLFVDPANGDFRLQAGSPALKLGFRPIDLSQVGPRSAQNQPCLKGVLKAAE